MDYELLKEDEHIYHLKDPKGKEVKIAKQAVSDAVHQKIKGFFKGGNVETTDEGDAPELGFFDRPKIDDARAAYLANADKFQQDALAREAADKAPRISPQEAGAVNIAPQSPQTNLIASNGPIPGDAIPIGGEATPGQMPGSSPTPPISDDFNQALAASQKPATTKGMDMLSQAAKMQSQSTQAFYNESERVKAEEAQALEKAQVAKDIEMTSMKKNLDESQIAVANGTINPDRLWSSASSGGRIGATISIMLGGLGQGLAGGPNQAIAMLNRMVDQDIDAQKADLGKKQTLYSMNLQKYKDAQTAWLATKADLAAVAAGKISRAAATMGSQQAKAIEQQALGAIQMEKDKLVNQIATQRQTRSVMSHMEKTGDARYAQILPEADRKEALGRVVPGFGMVSDPKYAEKANEAASLTKTNLSSLDKLIGMVGNGKLSLDKRAVAESLQQILVGASREDILGPGTISPTERATVERIIANPTELSSLSSVNKARLETLRDRMETRLHDRLKQFGVQVPAKLKKGAPVK